MPLPVLFLSQVNMKPKVPTKTVCEEHLELRKEILNLLNLRKQVYFVYFNSCDLHALLALLMILMFSVVTLPLCCNNFATGYMDLPLCFALLTARTQWKVFDYVFYRLYPWSPRKVLNSLLIHCLPLCIMQMRWIPCLQLLPCRNLTYSLGDPWL